MNTEYKCKCGNTASPFESCPNCEIPEPMNTKQLTYPSIESQKQFWIDKEAVMNNATNETRDSQLKAITKALWDYHNALDTCKHGGLAAAQLVSDVEIALNTPWIRGATINVAYNPQREISTTADPKPIRTWADERAESYIEDIGGNELPDRIEANQDWYEVERNDFDRGDLRDEGRNSDGSGLSYGERNT